MSKTTRALPYGTRKQTSEELLAYWGEDCRYLEAMFRRNARLGCDGSCPSMALEPYKRGRRCRGWDGADQAQTKRAFKRVTGRYVRRAEKRIVVQELRRWENGQ